MVPSLEQKIVAITPPGAIVDNASLTTASVDTQGWDYCDIIVHLGATDIAMAALKLRESDDDSTYADVTNGNFATATLHDGTAATLPAATDDNHFFAIHVDMRGHKRYLDLVATGGDGAAGAYITAWAILSRPQISPSSASGRGFTQELFV